MRLARFEASQRTKARHQARQPILAPALNQKRKGMNAVVKQVPQMVRYEAACKALAQAKAVDEVQDIRNKADAMRIYGMQAKNKTLEVDAAEIRIRAERRLGELLAQQKAGEGLNTGAKGIGTSAVVTDDRTSVPTLKAAGISKDLSSRAQKLAAVPKAEFEAEVVDWRHRVKKENSRVTTRLAKAGERAMKPAKPEKKPEVDKLLARIESLEQQLDAARENAAELADSLQGYVSAEAGVKEAAAEIKRLLGMNRVLEATRDQYMTKCAEMQKSLNSLQRKLGKQK